jgi:hypothetical protein
MNLVGPWNSSYGNDHCRHIKIKTPIFIGSSVLNALITAAVAAFKQRIA